MKIDTLTWEKVTIIYDEPVGPDGKKEEIFGRAYVSTLDGGLRIDGHPFRKDEFYAFSERRSILLAKATCTTLSSTQMEWTAYWWASSFENKNFERLVKATIVCVF